MRQWKMDRWKFFDITHRYHVVCNPMSIEKLDELAGLLMLGPESRVLDIACGKAEVLVRLAEDFGISGVGVDLSPYCIADARRKHQQRVSGARLQFIELDGAQYRPDAPESFDLAMCLGASWVYRGHRGTLRALKGMARPGGLVMVGEPFWVSRPPAEYLSATGMAEETFSTHRGNVAIGEEEGLTPLYAVVSSHDDWDRYVGLQWYAAAQYARANPGDADLPELLDKVSREREHYLRWERDILGWAIYLFLKPEG